MNYILETGGAEQVSIDDDEEELGFDDVEPNPTSPGINRAQFPELRKDASVRPKDTSTNGTEIQSVI